MQTLPPILPAPSLTVTHAGKSQGLEPFLELALLDQTSLKFSDIHLLKCWD